MAHIVPPRSSSEQSPIVGTSAHSSTHLKKKGGVGTLFVINTGDGFSISSRGVN